MINIDFLKNLFLLPIRVKKISAVTHNSFKKENERSKNNEEILNKISHQNDEILKKLSEQKSKQELQKTTTKKVLILGTSNSLLRNGWVSGFSEVLSEYEIINESVGASPGIQFAGIVSREDFSKYDYVIFDSIPNEESYYLGVETKGYLYKQKEDRVLFELLSTISAQTQLIVLGFCNNYAFDHESDIFKARKRMTCNVGGYFFDIRQILRLYKKIHKLSTDDIYEHTSHPKCEIALKIGGLLAKSIRMGVPCKAITPKNYSANFYSQTIRLKDREIEYTNSVMSMTASKIFKKDVINIDQNYRCLGFYVNAKKTHCYIDCTYEGNSMEESGLVYIIYNDQPGQFQKAFVPLQSFPIIDKVEIMDDSHSFNNIYYPILTYKTKVQPIDALELSEVLYWDDKNSTDPYGKDIFNYDESMLLTYKVINSFID